MKESPFVEYLIKIAQTGNKEILAKLRHGLGKRNGTPEMYRHVYMFNPQKSHEESYFLTGALFGYHPLHTNENISLGHAAGKLRVDSNSDGIELRFERLMKADREDLPILLRGIFSLMASKQIPINYHRLLSDLIFFNEATKKQWARDFWNVYKQINTKGELI